MQTLNKDLRRVLENTVRRARQVAEAGARAALQQLTVADKDAGAHLSGAQKALRNRLRAHARQLGDTRHEQRGTQAIERLIAECAYEHWHRLLFARFLAETELLIEPQSGQAISLGECQELARNNGTDWLELASAYAQLMLPEIFRTGDPVLEVALPPETRSALEDLMKSLAREVFEADDSLGWVYQFWQAEKKEEVNSSGNKIGAEELPAVTQLFTEDYMVLFLLHNTLGAWWAGKLLAKSPEIATTAQSESDLRTACSVGGVEWTYLRFMRDDGDRWRPAAGTFDGWPNAAKDITVLDPCMGSGHFLVFALPILAALRAEEERLSIEVSTQAVLRDNLFGLEIDPRCTQIAAFNLALAVWRRIGHRRLPPPHLACSGLSLGVTKVEWLKLAERIAAEAPIPPERDLLGTKDNLFSDASKRGFERLYDLFARAPWLGSLINPRSTPGDLIEHGFADLEPLLAKVMLKTDNAELSEMAVVGQGIAKAAEILGAQFVLVITNVPYLGRGKQDEVLKDFCERAHSESKADLATCFVERCLRFCAIGGSAALVTPQNWLFLGTYAKLRKQLLEDIEWNSVARLGEHGFESSQAAGAFTALLTLTRQQSTTENKFAGFDVTACGTPQEKNLELATGMVRSVSQSMQLSNPDARIAFEETTVAHSLLNRFAECYQGARTGDRDRFVMSFWEVQLASGAWEPFRNTSTSSSPWDGITETIRWDQGQGALHEYARITRAKLHDMHESGQRAWGRRGVAINQMRSLRAYLYLGEKFDGNVNVIFPADEANLPALWAFCSSPEYEKEVRRIDQKIAVTNATLTKVPFDLARWKEVAAKKYPAGLPKPHSDDSTQWLFDGHPARAAAALQVAVARLVGYRWPRQNGAGFSDCPSVRGDGLEEHTDPNGIVILSPAKGEPPAAERVIALLAGAFGEEWTAAELAGLLASSGAPRKTLDEWLRDEFFAQHCDLFHQRPFVWHIWDGRRDGFHALVNYHRLAALAGDSKRTLEKLIYTYLGDWIDRQRADQRRGIEGADARLAAAEQLKTELENVLVGEPPYDIFVRWKPLAQQPIGWEPDINDGVRVNIRPFMAAKPLNARARGACILRVTPKIKWDKDRGKEPQRSKEEYPWFWGWDEETQDFLGGRSFDGMRWNDLHYSVAVKKRARGQ